MGLIRYRYLVIYSLQLHANVGVPAFLSWVFFIFWLFQYAYVDACWSLYWNSVIQIYHLKIGNFLGIFMWKDKKEKKRFRGIEKGEFGWDYEITFSFMLCWFRKIISGFFWLKLLLTLAYFFVETCYPWVDLSDNLHRKEITSWINICMFAIYVSNKWSILELVAWSSSFTRVFLFFNFHHLYRVLDYIS